MRPLVSVIIPAHNVDRYVGEAVESALDQSFSDLEVIVVDDGSTDETANVLAALVARRPGDAARLSVLWEPRRGAAAARNRALDRAVGRYVAFLDADDRWHRHHLEPLVAVLEAEPGADLCFSGFRTIDTGGCPTGWQFRPDETATDLRSLLLENPIGCGSVVVARRRAVDEAGRFDETLVSNNDIDLWLRIAARRPASLRYVPRAGVDYRRRPGQITGDWERMARDRVRVLEKLRSLCPDDVAAVEREARVRDAVYYADLAGRAADFGAARRLLVTSLRSAPLRVARNPRAWQAAARIASAALPSRARAILLGRMRDRRRAISATPVLPAAPGGVGTDRPLRIAMLVYGFPEISQTFVLNEITGLLDRGHDVTVFALGYRPERGAVHESVDCYGLVARTVYLNPGGGARHVGAQWLRTLADVRPAGLRWLGALGAARGGAGLPSRAAAFRYAVRIARRGPFDLVHCQFGPLGLLAQRLRAAGALRCPLVTSFRGYDASQFVRAHGEDVYAALFRGGQLALTNCEFFRERLLELGCDASRVVVKRSGIDLDRFAFAPRRAPEAGPLVIAAVGRLVEKKGVGLALEGLARLPERHGRPELWVVGDGPLRPALEAQSLRLGLRERVRFLGALPQREVVAVLARAHLFLAPSVTAEDGDQDAPVNSLKEAMATGLPVVSTQHGGIPELVEEGVSGLLVPERDPAAIAGALSRLIDAPSEWEAMGRAGRARVERDYDRRTLDAALAGIYARVVAEARR